MNGLNSAIEISNVPDGRTTIDGYRFDSRSSLWKISRNHTINWDLLKPSVTPNFMSGFKSVIAEYACTRSAAHTRSCYERLKHFCEWEAARNGPVSQISAISIANYRSSLDSSRKWYVGTIAGLIRRWDKLGYAGIGEGVVQMLAGWRLTGNKKGEAIQLQSPTDGALTDLEFESLYSALTAAYENGELSLSDFVLAMLCIFSGRRPAQLADLQAHDLVEATAGDGLTEYVLNVPRRKVRGGSFREEFKPFAMSIDSGRAARALVQHNNKKLSDIQAARRSSSSLNPGSLPLFPKWSEVERFVELSDQQRSELPVDILHQATGAISSRISKIASETGAISERTKDVLNVFPLRLRRTIGTRAAREGLGELVIAEILDHGDIQNTRVYVENTPEHVNAINQAVALQLAPLAQAFSGQLIETAAQALRGDDPSSCIRSSSGSVMGNCGHYGFCGALAPIACYTCKNFQAWVDGPHQEVLDKLLADNERVSKLTGDPGIVKIMDRTILAVTRVIQLCDERIKQLGAA